jgi:zinc/manganese transport system substrate-binding protein
MFAAGAVTAMIAGVLAIAGCADRAEPKAGELNVVATTTVIGNVVGDLVKCAGGKTTTIMPVGADPHDFAPSSADLTKLVKADLVVTNGLGLEEGLDDAIANAKRDGARVFELAPKLDPIPFAGAEEPAGHAEESGEEHQDEHAAGSPDPHFWHDVSRMARAAKLVAAELGKLTKDTETFDRCGTKVAEDLTKVDAEVRELLNRVPENRRVMVTDHHAFGYFAARYGFKVVGVVIPGGSTMGSPSTAEIANLVTVIRTERVPAIFSNAALSSDLTATVAREAGSQVTVVPLFVGSLGEQGSGADTYRGMVLSNARRVADALAG